MKVFCLNKISPIGLKTFSSDYEIDLNSIEDSSIVLVRSANMHELELPESVLCVGRAGAGVNNIPINTYAENGVVVFNTPGANANAVKELTIAMLLLAARDINASIAWVNDNKNDENINKTMEKAKSSFAGNEIMGKTLGVIGCGAIGALVADAAIKLGMNVLGVEPSEATRERYKDLLKGVKFVDYDVLYSEADYISLHIPLLESTKGLINKTAFEQMKEGMVIINAARDALVNDDDLKEAIEKKIVKKYITDFPNYKTANMANVIGISHLGASTEEAEDNCAIMAAREVQEFIENGNIINSVNFPNIDLGPKEFKRIVVLYRTTLPSTDIIDVISKQKEIIKMGSSSKGEYGVLLVEFKDKCEQTCLCSSLREIPGIIRVRGIH